MNAIGDGLYDEGFRFLWQVNAPEFTTRFFRVEASAVEEPLESSSNETLECVVQKLKPAHTRVLFSYGS
jgi:uncharacterized protein YmfQ (DUF2313 family)